MTSCLGALRHRPAHLAALAVTALLFTAGGARAQGAPPPPRFSVKVNLVRLLVTVRDQTGRVVSDLGKEDFRIFDNGVVQTLSVFERNTSLPLSIAIMVDISGSTHKDLGYETSSILKFLEALKQAGNPEDSLAIYSFNWEVRMEVGFTRSEARAERALRFLKAEGGTSLYDAIQVVSQDLESRDGRHVVIVVTDGGDTTSYGTFQDAMRAAQQADAVLYPLVVVPIESEAGRNLGGEHALATMAASTGGHAFYPASADELNEAFAGVLRDLRTQYLLGYYPRDTRAQAGGYHPVAVEVTKPHLKASARAGYYDSTR